MEPTRLGNFARWVGWFCSVSKRYFFILCRPLLLLYSSVYSDSHPRRETLTLSLPLSSLCVNVVNTSRDDFRCFESVSLWKLTRVRNVKRGRTTIISSSFFPLKKIFTRFETRLERGLEERINWIENYYSRIEKEEGEKRPIKTIKIYPSWKRDFINSN